MKNINITLTEAEIEILQISLCETVLNLDSSIDKLNEHNRTGVNTSLINAKRERKNDCDNLWLKLYRAQESA